MEHKKISKLSLLWKALTCNGAVMLTIAVNKRGASKELSCYNLSDYAAGSMLHNEFRNPKKVDRRKKEQKTFDKIVEEHNKVAANSNSGFSTPKRYRRKGDAK